jgi:hypothetical protein
MTTTQRPALVILVDALPAIVVERLGLLRYLDQIRSVRPGLGYSITQKAEMLTGRLPDAQGILNHWQPRQVSSVSRLPAQAVLDIVRRRTPLLDHVAHKVVQRVRGDVLNIPWEQMDQFVETDIGYYDDTVQSGSVIGGFRSIIGEDRTGGFNDLETISEAKQRVAGRTERLFVSLAELDQIGHRVGPSGAAFEAHARSLDRALGELVELFRSLHADGRVVVFSDHGMLDVVAHHNLPGAIFDDGRGRRARYWLDSTMVRFWHEDPMVALAVRERVAGEGVLFLSEEERGRFGVTSPEFGRAIGLLPSGAVFNPNAFGSRAPRGMHGYHPDIAEHFGVMALGGALSGSLAAGPHTTLEFYGAVKASLEPLGVPPRVA